MNCGATIFSETVTSIDTSARPFKVLTDSHECLADTVIICTGAVARRLDFPGSDEDSGFWNKGISACAVCDGAMPMFRNRPIAVIGGGDSAMEEATFLTKYGSKVYIVHRRDALRASKVMQRRAQNNEKIEFVLDSNVTKAEGNEEGLLGSITVENKKTGETRQIEVAGLFFAIGHEPATAFLDGQLAVDEDKYVVTKPGSTQTSVPGVFAAGDVQDKKWRQAITAAGTGAPSAFNDCIQSSGNSDCGAHVLGSLHHVQPAVLGGARQPSLPKLRHTFELRLFAGCMAALEVEHFLNESS